MNIMENDRQSRDVDDTNSPLQTPIKKTIFNTIKIWETDRKYGKSMSATYKKCRNKKSKLCHTKRRI